MFSNDRAVKIILGVVLVLGIGVLSCFLIVLPDARSGEVAGALGSVLGGIIGAVGAALAVSLTLAGERREEARKASDAIRREVTEFSKYAIGALECCISIAKKETAVPKKNGNSIMIELDPVIYRAVADRIGILPFPQQVVGFYARIAEARGVLKILQESPSDEEPLVTPVLAATLAEILITACQLAHGIISFVPGPNLDPQISAMTLANIESALQRAHAEFPNAEAFT